MHIYKIVYIKTFKSLQHVSILRSSSGSYTVRHSSHIFKTLPD